MQREREMKTLNVFRLARNADFKLAHISTGDSNEDQVDRTITRSISSTLSREKFEKNTDFSLYPTYTQIDPDLIMAEQERKDDVLNCTQVNININEVTPPPVIITNGHNGHDIPDEPESYKRLINEAPFMTTAREPPIDLDHDMILSEKSNGMDGMKMSISSNGSKSNRSSRISIHKTESNMSVSCTSTSFDLELDWVDTKLIKEGRAFIRRHFLSVMFAHFIGIAFLMTVRPIAAILLRHGKFHKSTKRHWHFYLQAIRQLKSWYEKGDLIDTNDPATVEILQLRRCICTAGKNFKKYLPPPAQDLKLSREEETLQLAIKQDMNGFKDIQVEIKNIAKIFATVNPDVPWSQYDLAMTQFAFFGFVSLFPRVFGIYESKESKGMKGFIHVWAVLGHLLGLENRFNLCKQENFDEETNNRIFKHVFLFSFKIIDNGSYRMLQKMCDGSKWFTIFVTRIQLVLLFMIQEVAQTSTKNLHAAVKWYDRVQFTGYHIWTRWLVRLFFLRILGNFVARIILSSANVILLIQINWRMWRAKRKPPQMTVFPNSVSMTIRA